jgi:hypothetical protein
MRVPEKCAAGETPSGQTPIHGVAGWTKAIVRLDKRNRMVTKDYPEGVNE